MKLYFEKIYKLVKHITVEIKMVKVGTYCNGEEYKMNVFTILVNKTFKKMVKCEKMKVYFVVLRNKKIYSLYYVKN